MSASTELPAIQTVAVQELTERKVRQAKDAGHLENLDLLRGIAVLSVLGYHCVEAVWPGWAFFKAPTRVVTFDWSHATSAWLFPFHFGYLGVAIFFAVSGYCIHLSASRKAGPPGTDFFLKRFFRIVPAYYAVLLVLAAQRVHWEDADNVKNFVTHLFLVHNFSIETFSGLNQSFWSIAVEIQLYVLYPALWFCARRFGWRWTLALTFAIEMALRIGETIAEQGFGSSIPWCLTGSPLYYWFSWAIGAYAAEKYLQGEKMAGGRALGWMLIALGFVTDFWKASSNASFPLVAAGSAFLVAGGALIPRRWSGWLMLLGAWSYSIYLIHQPLLKKLGGIATERFANPNAQPMLLVFLSLVVIVPLAGVMYRVLEKPSIEAGQWFRSKLSVT